MKTCPRCGMVIFVTNPEHKQRCDTTVAKQEQSVAFQIGRTNANIELAIIALEKWNDRDHTIKLLYKIQESVNQTFELYKNERIS